MPSAIPDQHRSKTATGTTRVTIAEGLTEFPRAIFDHAETLEILDLSGNKLRSLPEDLPRLTKLKIAFFTGNCFEAVPEVLARCPALSMVSFKSNGLRTISETALPHQLRWLILTDNHLEKLPRSMGRLANLQKLALAGNSLRELPEEMSGCTNLELIRISVNQLQRLPPFLLRLPRLAWLAHANNPFCSAINYRAPSATTVQWSELTMHEILGQGGSGIISRATWRTPEGKNQEIAVKIYKGELTADGLPADEMRAGLAMGEHPHLVRVLGAVKGIPGNKEGLAFALNGSDFKTLAKPPDFDSCTRDIYPPDAQFTPRFITRVAQSTASAVAHLHARGILHGDFYAHNTQVEKEGNALLGDFGGACFYDRNDHDLAHSLEQIEARAFGYLLEELLNHCNLAAQGTELKVLRKMKDACLSRLPAARPLFNQIVDQLAA